MPNQTPVTHHGSISRHIPFATQYCLHRPLSYILLRTFKIQYHRRLLKKSTRADLCSSSVSTAMPSGFASWDCLGIVICWIGGANTLKPSLSTCPRGLGRSPKLALTDYREGEGPCGICSDWNLCIMQPRSLFLYFIKLHYISAFSQQKPSPPPHWATSHWQTSATSFMTFDLSLFPFGFIVFLFLRKNPRIIQEPSNLG